MAEDRGSRAADRVDPDPPTGFRPPIPRARTSARIRGLRCAQPQLRCGVPRGDRQILGNHVRPPSAGRRSSPPSPARGEGAAQRRALHRLRALDRHDRRGGRAFAGLAGELRGGRRASRSGSGSAPSPGRCPAGSWRAGSSPPARTAGRAWRGRPPQCRCRCRAPTGAPPPPSRSPLMLMQQPRGVNFTALDGRFSRICFSARKSASISRQVLQADRQPAPPPRRVRASAAGRPRRHRPPPRAPYCSCSLPASILAMRGCR